MGAGGRAQRRRPLLRGRGATVFPEAVVLEAGEQREVRFTLGPAELGLIDARMQQTVEPGDFELNIAGLSETFTVP